MRSVLLGYMGSGKSSVGTNLAQLKAVKFIDLDHFIEQVEGMSISCIFELRGEQAFRELEHRALRSILESKGDFVLSLGGGTPCFYGNMDLINRQAESIYLKGSADVLADHLRHGKAQRPLLSGKSQQDLSDFIGSMLIEREPFYSQAKHCVDIDGLSVNKIVKKIYETIII